MKPIGPLMREHRLIERMIKVMNDSFANADERSGPAIGVLAAAIDFIHTYADRTHHGKEEDLLFRALAGKPLSPEHRDLMQELIADHAYARKMTREIAAAKQKYEQGHPEVLPDIVGKVRELVTFYPRHIEKEDKHFFYPCLEYFTKREQDDLLTEFREFDRKLIHEKYERLVQDLEADRTDRFRGSDVCP